MDSQSTPRLTAPYLDRYVGRNVIIVGKVVQLRGEVATIDADGAITAQLNREAHLAPGSAAQLIGKINNDLSVRVLSSLDLGTGVAPSTSVPAESTEIYVHVADDDVLVEQIGKLKIVHTSYAPNAMKADEKTVTGKGQRQESQLLLDSEQMIHQSSETVFNTTVDLFEPAASTSDTRMRLGKLSFRAMAGRSTPL
ncbi:hypothetical protein BD289DRAFT_502858 [Coniella lustricola]|uniref:Replication factor A protein 3 n=1 Tax=Coniella lustricola TaxID=2025994 RepID=A0A2T3AJJ2_9PEZI|nr:hypothetical protein BD289DRAFT_502858 [Coniella lustricola]